MSPNSAPQTLNIVVSHIQQGLALLDTVAIPADHISLLEELDQLKITDAHFATRISPRVILSRELNPRNAPIYRLPPEIIGNILTYARDGFHGLSYLGLGAVCTYFHHVLRSTPQFWTRLHLDYPIHTASNTMALAKHHLNMHYKNAKDLLLDISISLPPAGAMLTNALCGEPSSKIENLSIRSRSKTPCTVAFTYPITFPHLRSLQLMQTSLQSTNDIRPVLDAPHLQMPGLHSSTIDLVFPWDRLHTITLWDCDAAFCLEALSQCSRLTRLSIHPRTPKLPGSDLMTTVTLSQLKSFNYHTFAPILLWERILTLQLALPALEELTWDSKFEQRQLGEIFFSRLQSLRVLDLSLLSHSLNPFARHLSLGPAKLLSHVPSVTSFRLRIPSKSRKGSIASLAILISSPSSAILPNLRELYIEWNRPLEPAARGTILLVVRSRRSRWNPLTECQLEVVTLECGGYEPWPPEFKDGWRELIKDGLRASIVEKGQTPSGWMCG